MDTSAWIFALRKEPVVKIKGRIDSLSKEDTVITTGVVKLEILAGTKTEKEYRRLRSRFDALDIPFTDIVIASCALQAGVVLLHADAHFDLMEKPFGLHCESYVHLVKKALS